MFEILGPWYGCPLFNLVQLCALLEQENHMFFGNR